MPRPVRPSGRGRQPRLESPPTPDARESAAGSAASDLDAVPDLTAADLRQVAEEIRREFPLVAQRSALVLFDVDPHQVQAQWQITDAALAAALGGFPPGATRVRPLLRLRRIEADGSSREVAALPQPAKAAGLDGVARLAVAEGGAELEAELGLASGEGGWLLLARSNRVRLPSVPRPQAEPGGPDLAPMAAPTVPSVEKTPEPRPAAPPEVAASLTAVGPRFEAAAEVEAAPIGGQEPAPAVSDAPVEPALAQSGPPLAPEFPLGWSDPSAAAHYLRLITQADAGSAAAPLAPSAPSDDSEGPVAPSAPPPDPGAWAELPPPLLPSGPAGGPPEAGPPSTRVGALSSVAWHALGPAPDWEIHAELHLWGRAAPGGLISVFGRPIRVGPDGHFALRLTLRDPEALTEALAKGEPAGPSDT